MIKFWWRRDSRSTGDDEGVAGLHERQRRNELSLTEYELDEPAITWCRAGAVVRATLG
ncbi:hypothetical protein [Microbispora sp. KK1-11]|uniref:hypothetical protein n=1 Tax=Microbispora sp. KK1-11 TaxID=2053005 RepID=UPI0021AFA0C7|nr:hypothetical protein [Microbispora sp. KK1-11]